MSKTIQIKGAPEELRVLLTASAARNFRSLNQEALARIKMRFDLEALLAAKIEQKWIDEAMSGAFRRTSVKKLTAIADKVKAAAWGDESAGAFLANAQENEKVS